MIKQKVASYETDIHPEDGIAPIKMEEIDIEVDTYVQENVSDYPPPDRNSQGKGAVFSTEHHTNNHRNSILTAGNEQLVNNKGACPENKDDWNNSDKGKKFYCPGCGTAFLKKFYLDLHLRLHCIDRPFPCMLCNKRFSQKNSLVLHLRTHSGIRPFPCMQCGYRFSQKHCLIRHLRICKKPANIPQNEKDEENAMVNIDTNSTTNVKKIFPCVEKDEENAIKNIDTNSIMNLKKIFPCAHCGKSFLQSYHLKVHLLKHSGEKPFSCVQCGKSFTQKTSLVIHLRTHSGDRPYPCMQCGYRFTQKHCLVRHLRICKKSESVSQNADNGQNVVDNVGTKNAENRKKIYSCIHCDKSFLQSSHLEMHLRKHTGEKPFPCMQCGKSFTQKTSLLTHSRTHTGDRPFPCMQCGYRFTQKHCLLRHLPICQKQKINTT